MQVEYRVQKMNSNTNKGRLSFGCLVSVTLVCMLSACTGMPDKVTPVTGFDVDRYLGTWYEIARLDHSFERGLVRVTADYSLREDGGLQVINRGFDSGAQRWKKADGKAYFIGAKDVGRLKVSFFGPFYGSYNIIALDKQDYRYAMVCGPNTQYLWILSREPALDERILERLLEKASTLGFDTGSLIYVKQQLP